MINPCRLKLEFNGHEVVQCARGYYHVSHHREKMNVVVFKGQMANFPLAESLTQIPSSDLLNSSKNPYILAPCTPSKEPLTLKVA